MNELILKDELSRKRIVKETGSNFFVEAGAGSGKTTMLVTRMVAMVEAGIDVSRICAITFTKAAAGEFYSRFQDALTKRSLAEPDSDEVKKAWELGDPTDETRARCREALTNIDLCFMGTIDSFCNMILSEHPAEAGVPSNARILSDPEMDALYKAKYSEIQNGRHGADLKAMNRSFRSLYKKPDEVFLKTVRMLMERRNADFACPAVQPGEIDDIFREERTAVQSLVKGLLAHPESAYQNNDDSRKAWAALPEKSEVILDSWEGRLWEVINAISSLKNLRLIPEFDPDGLGPQGREFFKEHFGKNKLSWYEVDKEELQKVSQKIKDYQYSITIRFITKCISVIEEELKVEGAFSFFDYMLYLRNMLQNDAGSGGKLIRHIYGRHSYYLIDEFQDTNPMQAEIFFYLTAVEPDPDWRKCVPHPGSVFIVGDPKQSIYRFRNADVSSYLRVKEMFRSPVGEVLYLSRNFRSTYRMNCWFNRVFRELLPEDTRDQSKFEEIPLEDPPAPDGTFEGIYTYKCRSGKSAASEEKDPSRVAQVIRSLVHHPDKLIKGKKKDDPLREICYGDFMLITPGKGKLHEYAAQLTAYHIPYRVEGRVVFRECPALKALTEIYLAVAMPNEPGYLYNALSGSIYHIPEKELLRLKGQGLVLSVFSDNEKIAGTERVKGVLQELKELYFLSEDLSPAALFSLILEKYDLCRITGTENLEYVYYALELLRAAQSAGEVISPEDGGAFLENLLTDDESAERCLSLARNADRVHIANLHKVKGLEAPIVILAGQTRSDKAPEVRVEQTDEGARGWIFRIKKEFNNCYTETAQYPDEEAAEKDSLQAEKHRLLYVAATRARRALIIGDVRTSKDERAKNNAWEFFSDRSDDELFRVVNEDVPYDPAAAEVSAAELYEKNAALDFADLAMREQSYEILRPSMIRTKALTDSEDEFEDVAEADEVRKDQRKRNPALIGTIVHRLMEMLVSSRNTADLEEAVREIAQDYEADEPYYTDILRKVGNTVRGGGFPQETSVPQDILQELLGAEEVHCEIPFCHNEGAGKIWHGVMDVLYKKDGQWHIIDYKTNADPEDLDEKYREQMKAYTAAFKAMTGEEADARVYHITV